MKRQDNYQPWRFIRWQAFCAILTILMVTACGGSALRANYINDVNDILETHTARHDAALTEMESVVDGAMNNQWHLQHTQADISEVVSLLDLEVDELRGDITKWLNLTPPEEADKFHELIFESMNLRLVAMETVLYEMEAFAAGFELDIQRFEAGIQNLIEADRLWGLAGIEGRKLNR